MALPGELLPPHISRKSDAAVTKKLAHKRCIANFSTTRHERPWRRGKIAGSCSSGDISAAARVNRNAGGTVECASADVGGIENHISGRIQLRDKDVRRAAIF